jgi:hypothetical protein
VKNRNFFRSTLRFGPKKPGKFSALAAVMLAAVLLFPGCGIFYKPAFRGRVTDAETGKPVAGAAVVARYSKSGVIGGPGGPSSYFQGARETLTDENGEFRIPPYFALTPFCAEENTDFVIFKPGYGDFPFHSTSPRCMQGVSYEDFFSEKMFGTLGKAECYKGHDTTEITVIFGMVELPEAKTWEERREAASISVGCSESICPTVHRILKKEEEWLYRNKERKK